MKPEIRILPNPSALCVAAAEEFCRAAKNAVSRKGYFTVVLSGGSTPKALYSMLAVDARLRATIPWEATHFFWGDERHVAPADPQSNFRMANEAMLSKLPIRNAQVHRIKAELADAAEAAKEYEQQIRGFFEAIGAGAEFDLVMLGMGPDGHTASLFPDSPALQEHNRLVVANHVKKLNTDRITMTASALNRAGTVMFLVQGEDKAATLKSVLEGDAQPDRLPSQLIRPVNGRLVWLVDRAAASMLSTAE